MCLVASYNHATTLFYHPQRPSTHSPVANKFTITQRSASQPEVYPDITQLLAKKLHASPSSQQANSLASLVNSFRNTRTRHVLRNVRRHPSHICFQRAVDIYCLAMFFCQYDPSVSYLCLTYIPYYEIFLCHAIIYLLSTAAPGTVRHLRQNCLYIMYNSTVSTACTPHSRQSTSRQKYMIRVIPSDIGTARY